MVEPGHRTAAGMERSRAVTKNANMMRITFCLLTLLFSLSAPAMEGNADFWRSSLAAKSANLADNVADAARLRNQLAAQEIAGGHAFGKHVVKEGQFPGITTPQQFGAHIENIMNNPSAVRHLSNGRTAYWDNASGTVVIRHPSAKDGGTAFKPTAGVKYFNDTLK